MQRVSRIAFVVLTALALGALLPACGADEEEAAFHEATDDLAEAQRRVAAAREAVEAEEREVAAAREDLEKAHERLNQAVAALEDARQRVGRHATDEVLFREVQRKLIDDEELAEAEVAIRANVTEGVVVLQGKVPDAELRGHAEKIAGGTPGVVGVENRIAVVEPPAESD